MIDRERVVKFAIWAALIACAYFLQKWLEPYVNRIAAWTKKQNAH
jgi:HAMP domain-containing protein